MALLFPDGVMQPPPLIIYFCEHDIKMVKNIQPAKFFSGSDIKEQIIKKVLQGKLWACRGIAQYAFHPGLHRLRSSCFTILSLLCSVPFLLFN